MTAIEPTSLTNSNLYEEDFYLWIETTVKQLKAGNLAEVDLANLIEEIESIGKSEKRALKSNLIVILMHLLKYKYQPVNNSKFKIQNSKFKIQNSKFKIKDIFRRGFKPRLKMMLPVEVGVLNPLIYDKRSNSWLSTIFEHRRRLREGLTESPSLRKYFSEVFSECYQDARKQASLETGLLLDTFPVDSPFTTDETLNQDFLPE